MVALMWLDFNRLAWSVLKLIYKQYRWTWSGSRDPFKRNWTLIIFETDEGGHF